MRGYIVRQRRRSVDLFPAQPIGEELKRFLPAEPTDNLAATLPEAFRAAKQLAGWKGELP